MTPQSTSDLTHNSIFFLYRIFPIVNYRRFLLGCHVFVGLLGLSSLLAEIFHCIPIHDVCKLPLS